MQTSRWCYRKSLGITRVITQEKNSAQRKYWLQFQLLRHPHILSDEPRILIGVAPSPALQSRGTLAIVPFVVVAASRCSSLFWLLCEGDALVGCTDTQICCLATSGAKGPFDQGFISTLNFILPMMLSLEGAGTALCVCLTAVMKMKKYQNLERARHNGE